MFIYFRDPDGHRIELFNTHYQVMDIENEPVRWNAGDPNVSFPWGLPAQRREARADVVRGKLLDKLKNEAKVI